MNRTVFMVAPASSPRLRPRWVYGFGGKMAVNGTLTVGTPATSPPSSAGLYAPLTAISNVRVDVMTALVPFERASRSSTCSRL